MPADAECNIFLLVSCLVFVSVPSVVEENQHILKEEIYIHIRIREKKKMYIILSKIFIGA